MGKNRRDSRPEKPWGLPLFGLYLVALFGLGYGLSALAGVLGFPQTPGFDDPMASLPSALAWLVASVAAAALVLKLEGRPLQEVGFPFHPGMYLHLALGFALAIALGLVAWAVPAIAHDYDTHGSGTPPAQMLREGARVVLLVLALAATEELVFRGAIQRFLARRLSTWQAVLCSSLLFAITHGVLDPEAPLLGLVGIAVAGGMLGLAYARSGSLWLSLGLHAGWNLAIGWVAGLPVSGKVIATSILRTEEQGSDLLTGGSFGPEASLVGIAALALGILAVRILPIERAAEPQPGHPDHLHGRVIALDPARLEARLRRLAFLVPWVSLALGVSAAIWMERTPGRAVVVAAGSAFGWLALVGLAILDRIEHPRRSARLLAVARWSAGALTVGALQQSLFFSIPFYVRASDGSPQHVIFVATLVIAALATLWDPLVDRLMARAITAIPLQAVATFAGLNAVLPILGLSNRAGLIGGAIGAVLGIPLFAVLVPTGIDRRRLAGFVVAALAVPALLLLRPVRALVPAAPLRFVAGAIGTRLEGREPADPASVLPTAPEQLVCATAVEAPRGLRDRLEHVWLHGGDVVDRIPLEVRGGREQGFRTFSVKKHLGVRPEGTWTCAVETVSGQRLGSVRVVIQSPRS